MAVGHSRCHIHLCGLACIFKRRYSLLTGLHRIIKWRHVQDADFQLADSINAINVAMLDAMGIQQKGTVEPVEQARDQVGRQSRLCPMEYAEFAVKEDIGLLNKSLFPYDHQTL